eukprot:m.221809 g.221809  ORF g.221809 m.221809 type:complete len:410 (+) comp15890_c1_seq1:57-1286(+)
MALLKLVFLALVALSVGQEWRIVKKNIATIDIGVTFINPFVGYTAATENGSGPAIFKSQDGGHTWTTVNVTSFGLDILLMDIDAAGDAVVVSSEAGELYSADGGKSFHLSVGGGLSQSVRHVGSTPTNHKFAVTGDYTARHKDGVALSVDSGRTFTAYDASLFTEARYGAFPTETAWYVAAGEWPQSPQPGPSDDDDGGLSPRQAAFLQRKSQIFNRAGRLAYRPGQPLESLSDDAAGGNGTYCAQLSKSTDGGITWKTIFAENHSFYFNGIDCSPADPNHCCAVGEGFAQPPVPSTEPGARIHCTRDGGATWNRTYWNPETASGAFSLMEIRFANATEIWAAGSKIANFPSAMWVHSSDGGKTWTTSIPDHLLGTAAMSISMVSPSIGYSSLINSVTQQSDIAKYGGI